MSAGQEPGRPVVRLGRASDAAVLAELGARTFRATFGADNRPDDVETYLAATYGPGLQAAELADPACRYLVAEMAGVVVGFALLTATTPGDAIPGMRPLRMLRLYVDHEVLGTGVGAALMRACIDDSRGRGHDVLWLGVWEHNTAAISFYRRWGFTTVGEERFTLGTEPQRDLLMALTL